MIALELRITRSHAASARQAAWVSLVAAMLSLIVFVRAGRADETKALPLKSAASAGESSPQPGLLTEIPAKALRYLERRFQQLDVNHNGRLEREEWQALKPSPTEADANADGILTLDELKNRVLNYGRARRVRIVSSPSESPAEPATTDANGGEASENPEAQTPVAENPTGDDAGSPKKQGDGEGGKSKPRRNTRFFVRTPQGVPDWWNSRDANGDGQLTLKEFAPQASAADIAAFGKLDVNNDGVLTPAEYARSNSAKKPEAPKADAAKSPTK